MSKKTVFTGIATALITPLTPEGVDFQAFGRLIDDQVASDVGGLVVCGTTGEGSTLTDEEHKECIRFCVERVAGKKPVIAGTGSNDTAYALDLTKYACDVGVDGVLIVTPYYNKATQKGLVRMFSDIADFSTKPVILYNVPSRTGVNIEPATYAELADHPNISGFKEANGNIGKIVETVALVGDKLDLYSGNDDQIVPLMALGAKGCISVLSNVVPNKAARICSSFAEGNIKESLALQTELLPLINALFCEVNPIPVKAAMAALGYCEDYLRLPLTNMEQAHKEKLLNEMRKQGLNV